MGVALSKSKNCKIMFLLVVFLLSTIPSKFSIAQAQEDTWKTLAPMPTPRSRFGLIVINDKIYAIGGLNNGTYLNSNEKYDPKTNSWTTLTPMPTPRSNFAITTHQNKIYITAGTNSSVGKVTTTEVYDTKTDTWETIKPIPADYLVSTSAHTLNDKIYVIGGGITPFPPWLSTYDNYVYNILSKYWIKTDPSLISVWDYASVVVDNKIYVMGGFDSFSNPSIINVTQIYDPALDEWSSGVPLPTGEYQIYGALTSGVYAPKRIHVFGPSLHYEFNFDTEIWSSEFILPSYRDHFQVAVIDDFIYAIGGRDQNYTALAINQVYTPVGHTLTYTVPSSSPSPTPTLSPTPTPTVEPTLSPTSSPQPQDPEFPIFIVASILIITVSSIAILVYGVKTKRRS